MVPFAGWEMPVQYPAGILAEHQHCRAAAALFDVSHMGQVRIDGADAAAALERLVPGDIQGLAPGAARYTHVHQRGRRHPRRPDRQPGRRPSVRWSSTPAAGTPTSPTARGARAADREITRARRPRPAGAAGAGGRGGAGAAGARLPPSCSFMSTAEMSVGGTPCRVSRARATPARTASRSRCRPTTRSACARACSASREVKPAGLGARDSLRLEAGLCLYGHDIDRDHHAGRGRARLDHRASAGARPAASRVPTCILAQLADGPAAQARRPAPEGRAPAREGTRSGRRRPADRRGHQRRLRPDGRRAGRDGLRRSRAAPSPGTAVELLVRGKPLPAQVVALPFVPHRYHR